MSKNTLPKSLKSSLTKRGWDIEIYEEIYHKCASWKALTGSDYHAASALVEIGFMCRRSTPIWSGDSYKGSKIEFLAYVPI